MPFKYTINPFTGNLDAVNAEATPFIVSAICKSSDSVGDCVKIDDVKAGALYQVEKADITVVGSSVGMGIIISKATSTTCQVQLNGIMSGVYTSLTAGDLYVIGTDSQLTNSLSPPSSGFRYFQIMGVAVDSDEFLINPSFPRTKLTA